MIRPVLYVDLPGIIYALDRRSRGLGRSFATFVCAPDYEETHSGLSALLMNMLPVRPTVRTWISEEHWRLLGIAQAKVSPGSGSWDIQYLASLTHHEANPADVMQELIEYAVNSAINHGMHRVFARTLEDPEIISIFQRIGFQCYAHEVLYVRPTLTFPNDDVNPNSAATKLHIRRWTQHDPWGLTRLHDATTPRRVQVAETLGSDELAHQFVPRMRNWHILGLEPRDESYVVDTGSRLDAWVRIRQGWAGLPHQIWLKIHPEHSDIAQPLVNFALQRLRQSSQSQQLLPVICQLRDYEAPAIDALRGMRFEHVDTKASLVRHLTVRVHNERTVVGMEPARRMNYGVKGLGTIQSVPIENTREALHATHDH